MSDLGLHYGHDFIATSIEVLPKLACLLSGLSDVSHPWLHSAVAKRASVVSSF